MVNSHPCLPQANLLAGRRYYRLPAYRRQELPGNILKINLHKNIRDDN